MLQSWWRFPKSTPVIFTFMWKSNINLRHISPDPEKMRFINKTRLPAVLTLIIAVIIVFQLWDLARQNSRSTTEPKLSDKPTEPQTGNSEPGQDYVTSDEEFASRLAKVKAVCEGRRETLGAVKNVLKMEKPRVIFCLVAKAGCTFWKAVFIRMQEKVIISSLLCLLLFSSSLLI